MEKTTMTKVQEKIKSECGIMLGIVMMLGIVLAILAVMSVVNGIPRISREEGKFEAVMYTISSAFNYGFSSAVAFIVVGILHEMTNSYTPFSKRISKYLGVISTLLSFLALTILVFSMVLDGRGHYFGSLSAFMFPIVIAAIVFGVLSRVFEYGRLLQQEADETL